MRLLAERARARTAEIIIRTRPPGGVGVATVPLLRETGGRATGVRPRSVNRGVMNKLQDLEPLPEDYVTKLLSSPSFVPTQKADVQKSDSPGAKIARLSTLLDPRQP